MVRPPPLPWGESPEDAWLERLEFWLDRAFPVPGLGVRIGLDGLIGLVPVVGDVLMAALAVGVPIAAWRRGASWPLLARMGVNIALDALIGLVPVVGDVLDIANKSNARNLRMLREALTAPPGP